MDEIINNVQNTTLMVDFAGGFLHDIDETKESDNNKKMKNSNKHDKQTKSGTTKQSKNQVLGIKEEKSRGLGGTLPGTNYQIQVYMLFALEGYRKRNVSSSYNFKILCENEEAGKFDDVIYQYQYENSDWQQVLVQVKHKQADKNEESKKIKTANLLSDNKKETFSLLTFLTSFCEIKEYNKNAIYVILTNIAFLFENENKLKTDYKMKPSFGFTLNKICHEVDWCIALGNESQYKIDGKDAEVFFQYLQEKGRKFTENDIEDFFDKLVFAVDQPSIEDFNKVIEDKIIEIIPGSDKSIRTILYDKINDVIVNRETVTPEWMDLFFDNVKHEQDALKLINSEFNKSIEECHLEYNQNIPIHNFLQSEKTFHYIKTKNCILTAIKLSAGLKNIRENKGNLAKYTRENRFCFLSTYDLERHPNMSNHVYSALKAKQYCNLLVFVTEEVSQLEYCSQFKKINDSKKIIVITKDDKTVSNDFDITNMYEDTEIEFDTLTKVTQSHLLNEEYITVNGNKTSFAKILQLDAGDLTNEKIEELNEVITVEIIENYTKRNQIEISFKQNNQIDFDKSNELYIERSLIHQAVINVSDINNSNLPYDIIITSHKGLLNKDNVFMLKVNQKEKEEVLNDLIVIDNTEDFNLVCQNYPHYNVHYFETFSKNNNKLLWVQTRGNIENLKEYFYNCNNFVEIQEDVLVKLNNNLFLICDLPGMGKSMLVSSMIRNINKTDPLKVTIRINLSDYYEMFNENKNFRECTRKDILDYFVDIILKQDLNSISKVILKYILINHMEVYLFFDGLDEVYSVHKETVLEFLACLKMYQIGKIIITTRPVQIKILEEHLSTLSFSLKPFSEDNQKQFLIKSLEYRIEDFLYEYSNIVKLNLCQLLGVPLFLKMLALIKKEKSNFKCENISTLFSEFIEHKFRIYTVEKKKQHPSILITSDEKLITEIRKKQHEYIALLTLFDRMKTKNILGNIEISEDDMNVITRIGIVVRNDTNKPEFIHQTFAEYFASKYIEEHINEQPIIDIFVEDILTGNDYIILRKLLNNNCNFSNVNDDTKFKYKNSFKNILADKKYSNILFEILGEDNINIAIFVFDCIKEHEDICKNLTLYNFNKKGTILHWAARENKMDIVNLLLNHDVDINLCDDRGRTPLVYAAMQNNCETIRLLIERDCNLFSVDNNGYSALHWAAKMGAIEAMNLLLDYGMDINIPEINHATPLFYAVGFGGFNAVKTLLNRGSNINVSDKNNITAIHRAAGTNETNIVKTLLDLGMNVNIFDNTGKTPMFYAAKGGNESIIKLLFERGSDINIIDTSKTTALHWAIRVKQTKAIDLLLDYGADINARDKIGKAPLVYAIQYGTYVIAKMLLDRKCNINISDNKGCTPLHYAVSNDKINIMKLLLDNHADVNKTDKFNETSLFYAIRLCGFDTVKMLLKNNSGTNIHNDLGNTPLHYAVHLDKTDLVKLLLEYGANVNACNNERDTPISYAATWGSPGTVKILLERGCNQQTTDIKGVTVLHQAIIARKIDIVKLFLDYGMDINTRDCEGKTSLIYAVIGSDDEIVKTLLERGCNINAIDCTGSAALHYAVMKHRPEILKLILNHNPNINILDIKGRTPLCIVVEKNYHCMVKILIEHGADLNIIYNDGKSIKDKALESNNDKIIWLFQ